ncbi:MAG: dTDP-4-dehydrorhamnose reductase [Actinobacteria bacterium]|nr:dTDP-4-dehydrorhamnose reductase [Actinomycetota bacterium]
MKGSGIVGMKLLITGSKGQMGMELINTSPPMHEVYGFDMDMDITDRKAVFSTFKDIKPDAVIHCAAYTDVDGCERNSDKAFLINGTGTRNIAEAARRTGSEMIYLSTDYVFDGSKKAPYLEYDEPAPLSIYGKSKLAGEAVVREILGKYYIVRTTGIYSSYGRNFVETIIASSKKNGRLEVVNDQVCTPTYSLDLANCLYRLLDSKKYGTYHATNNGMCTWYSFSREIFRDLDMDIEVVPVESARLNRDAKRPAFSVLENANLEKLGICHMRDWKAALKDFLDGYHRQDRK